MSHRRNQARLKRRKGIYILPNLFTTGSLFAGFYAILAAVNQDFTTAAAAVIVAGLFDFLDGKIARMTHTTSQFGLEYDSLADLVAFGAAPAVLSYLWALKPLGRLGWAAAFLFVACGALRLARFNVNSPNRSEDYFQGLPIPAAAAMIATTVFLFTHLDQAGPLKQAAVLMLIFALSFLMVSNFRYFSLKNPELLKSKPFNTLVGAILVFTLVAVRPQVMLFILTLSYVLSGPVLTVYLLRKLRRARKLEAHQPEAE